MKSHGRNVEEFYMKEIIPTPKEVEYKDVFLPIVDIRSGRAYACIVRGINASEPEKTACYELNDKIAELTGERRHNLKILTDEEDSSAYEVIISVGKVSTNRLNNVCCEKMGVKVSEDYPGKEGYIIQTVEEKERRVVVCAGSDDLGTYWSVQSLVQLLGKREDAVLLREAFVRDWPSFRIRSFKYEKWVNPDLNVAREMCAWAARYKFNTYNADYTWMGVDGWCSPTEEYRKQIADLCKITRSRGMSLMQFVNPYWVTSWEEDGEKKIRISKDEDIDTLVKTFKISLDQGAERIMLCLDDCASKYTRERGYHITGQEDKDKFGRLEVADAHLVNELHRKIKKSHPECEIFFVPPYYNFAFFHGSFRGSDAERAGIEYLKYIGKHIPEDVNIVWTGPVTRSVTIREKDIAAYEDLVQRKMFLWDNSVYAHHWPQCYLLDVFDSKRPPNFHERTTGVHINTRGKDADDFYAKEVWKVGLIMAADYLWNPGAYDPEEFLRRAIVEVAGEGVTELLLNFRDKYYSIRDRYPFLEGVFSRKGRIPSNWEDFVPHLRERDMENLRRGFVEMRTVLDEIKGRCGNKTLVAELEYFYSDLEALAKDLMKAYYS